MLSANVSNILFGQPGQRTSCAPEIRPMSDSIGMVLHLCSPAQVGEPVVRGISIEMTALHSFGTRTDERLEDQSVDEHVFEATFAKETNPGVGMLSWLDVEPQQVPSVRQDPSDSSARLFIGRALARPDRPVVADSVAGVAWDLAVFNGRIGSRHARLL